MNAEHEKRFMAIVEEARLRVDLMDALRALISDVADAAFDSGVDIAMDIAGVQRLG
jgi:hypothetical protein